MKIDNPRHEDHPKMATSFNRRCFFGCLAGLLGTVPVRATSTTFPKRQYKHGSMVQSPTESEPLETSWDTLRHGTGMREGLHPFFPGRTIVLPRDCTEIQHCRMENSVQYGPGARGRTRADRETGGICYGEIQTGCQESFRINSVKAKSGRFPDSTIGLASLESLSNCMYGWDTASGLSVSRRVE